VGGIGLAASPASATPTGPIGSAFVWASSPTTASYVPPSTYQWNSTSGVAVNSITRSGVGSYTVNLPGLGASSGTVLVTAYGSTTDYCKVVNWGPNHTSQAINVHCFTNVGAPADSQFTLSYSNGNTGNSRGYAWANEPTSPSYTPSTSYQGNTTGATNTITRSGVGAYQVIFPNLAAAAGHAQVTAYGAGSERCKVAGWGPSGGAQAVSVRCFTAAGAAADTLFTITYVRDGNVLGETVCCGPNGNPTAYAWADQPTAASYAPASAYQFPGWASSTITRAGTGDYMFKTPVNLGDGNVQVTAYGGGSEYCKVVNWNDVDGVRVHCYTAAGAPVDTFFDVSFVGPYIIG
jgi:hypothetical protein